MTEFSPQHVELGPIWDGNTDEVSTSSMAGAGGQATLVVPAQCYAMWLSTDGAHGDEVYVSPSATTLTGISFNSSIRRDLLIRVAPGVTLNFENRHGTTATVVNAVRFYNQPA